MSGYAGVYDCAVVPGYLWYASVLLSWSEVYVEEVEFEPAGDSVYSV